jgi:carbamate kinase
MIEQELGNLLPFEQPFATILTMVEVDRDDAAFQNPTKPIGPLYSEADAKKLAAERGWTVAPEGKKWRRVVPSPVPMRVFEIRPIQWLLDNGVIVICAGGGGIPTMYRDDGTLEGADVVVDKDRASALLATQLEADVLIMATDVDGVYLDWDKPEARLIRRTTPEELRSHGFASGSMRPKVEAACAFASIPHRWAAIGALTDLEPMVQQKAGTVICRT